MYRLGQLLVVKQAAGGPLVCVYSGDGVHRERCHALQTVL